jgi:hypothetical protein
MKLTYSENKVKAQKPPDDTLEYEIYVSGPHQEIIELTEVVEEGTPVGKEEASATRTPARPSEGFELVREEPGPERQTLEPRSGLRPTVLPQTASAKEETGPAQERRPEAKATNDEAVPIATEDRKPDSGDQRTEDLESDQIFAEFFSSQDAEDLCEKITGAGGSFQARAKLPETTVERRRYHRVRVRWPTTLDTSRGAIDGMTRNLSFGGVFLYHSHADPQALPLRTDDRLDVVFEIPGHEQIQARVRVAWSDILATEETSTVVGAGLEFVDIRHRDHEYLLQVIKERKL